MNKGFSWEEVYTKKFPFGKNPDLILHHLVSEIKPGKVLDLGVGDGRNAVFLAKHGFNVKGIDFSQNAIKICKKRFAQQKLKGTFFVKNIEEFDFEKNKYSLIVSNMTLHHIEKQKVKKIIKKCKQSLIKGGFLYISVLSISDPEYEPSKKKSMVVKFENNTAYHNDGDLLAFYEKKEILNLMSEFKLYEFSDIIQVETKNFKKDKGSYGVIIYIGQKIK